MKLYKNDSSLREPGPGLERDTYLREPERSSLSRHPSIFSVV